jgi:uncharacterized lipoprotein YehR (DUF1307 family)
MNSAILSVTILIGCIIIGSFYYASEANKQTSIERQKANELSAKKKQDCLSIYKVESDKYNNVVGWSYSDYSGLCEIRYKDKEKDEVFTKLY